MLIRRGFKFELRPKGMQIQLMMQFCGCARYVYNRTLSLEKSLYKKDSKHSFKYTAAANRLPGWKKESFFKEMPQPGASAVIKGVPGASQGTRISVSRNNFDMFRISVQTSLKN